MEVMTRMAEHMCAWFESADQVTLTRITTVQDDVLTPSGTERFLVPQERSFIHWAYATGVSLTQARIVTPSLEVMKSDLDINPFTDGSDLLVKATPAIWVPPRPIPLVPSESIEMQTSEDGGTTTTQAFVVLGDGNNAPMADGPIRSVRASGNTTLTPDTWTSVTLSLESSLEAGRYQLVHFMMTGVSPIACRFLPQGGGFRPGMFCSAAPSPNQFDWGSPTWQSLGWYNMLEFSHITIPQIQVFATAGDTVQTVQMYIIRIGDI